MVYGGGYGGTYSYSNPGPVGTGSYATVAASSDGTWAIEESNTDPSSYVSLQQADPGTVEQEITNASNVSGVPYFTDGSTEVGALGGGAVSLLNSHTMMVYNGEVGVVDGATSQGIEVKTPGFALITQDPTTGKIDVKMKMAEYFE